MTDRQSTPERMAITAIWMDCAFQRLTQTPQDHSLSRHNDEICQQGFM